MEENVNNQQAQQVPQIAEQQNPQQQINPPSTQEKSKGLMPGQESEDELDAMGAIMFATVRNGFNWIKNLFVTKKVE